jgi:hypothetical protein
MQGQAHSLTPDVGTAVSKDKARKRCDCLVALEQDLRENVVYEGVRRGREQFGQVPLVRLGPKLTHGERSNHRAQRKSCQRMKSSATLCDIWRDLRRLKEQMHHDLLFTNRRTDSHSNLQTSALIHTLTARLTKIGIALSKS